MTDCVRVVDLNANNIAAIPFGAFRGPYSGLERLHLASNQISRIDR